MPQTTFSIRMDENLKKQFELLCHEFGMNMTTAITIYAKTVTRQRRIPFAIECDDAFYSGANLRHLRKSLEQWNDPTSPKIVKTMEELEAMANE